MEPLAKLNKYKMKYLHLKSGRTYEVLSDNVINGTNVANGQRMVLYKGKYKGSDEIGLFVREFEEFHEKFKKIEE